MALSKQDLDQIGHLFDDRFNHIDAQLHAIRTDIDDLARATNWTCISVSLR
jgi:hypothetical protein